MDPAPGHAYFCPSAAPAGPGHARRPYACCSSTCTTCPPAMAGAAVPGAGARPTVRSSAGAARTSKRPVVPRSSRPPTHPLRKASSMPTVPDKRRPRFTLRLIRMLLGTSLVFGGVFAVKAILGTQTNKFFDNMPQPAAAVSAAAATTASWGDDADAVGTFVAVNGTDVTTEAGGVVRAIGFEAGQPVKA